MDDKWAPADIPGLVYFYEAGDHLNNTAEELRDDFTPGRAPEVIEQKGK